MVKAFARRLSRVRDETWLRSKADVPALPELSELVSVRYFSLLTGAARRATSEDRNDLVSVLCFLIPSAMSARLALHSSCLNDDDWREIIRCRQLSRRSSKTAARVVLKLAISKIARRGPPSRWKFSRSEQGRLHIANLPGYYCSLSHTEKWQAVAVSETLDVGLDIETSGLDVPHDMMRSFLSPNEILEVESAQAPQKRDLFLKAWAMKELIVKLSGAGVSESIASIDTAFRENWLFRVDELDTDAIVFAFRMSELAGDCEQGWLSLALAIPEEERGRIVKLAIYRLRATI